MGEVDQYDAWSCLVAEQPVHLDVESPSTGNQMLNMHPPDSLPDLDGDIAAYNFSYGPQVPKIRPSVKLYWVTDLRDPERGPALHFHATYDKVVILDQDRFQPPQQQSRKKRSPGPPGFALKAVEPEGGSVYTPTMTADGGDSSFPSDGPERHNLEAGDMPWFCFWNQTWIEGFIYVLSAEDHALSSKELKEFQRKAPLTTPAPNDPYRRKREIHPRDPEYARAHEMYKDAFGKRHASPRPASSWPPPTSSFIFPIAATQSPDPFPYLMKIQEQRVASASQSTQPYCQKMFIDGNGRPVPMPDAQGQPIVIELIENSPPDNTTNIIDEHEALESASPSASSSSNPSKRALKGQLRRRDDDPSTCHCLWVTNPNN